MADGLERITLAAGEAVDRRAAVSS